MPTTRWECQNCEVWSLKYQVGNPEREAGEGEKRESEGGNKGGHKNEAEIERVLSRLEENGDGATHGAGFAATLDIPDKTTCVKSVENKR